MDSSKLDETFTLISATYACTGVCSQANISHCTSIEVLEVVLARSLPQYNGKRPGRAKVP